MAKLASSFMFGEEVCQALGLNPAEVRQIEVKIEAGNIPICHVTMFIPETNTIAEVLRKYELCPLGTSQRLRELEAGG